MSETTSRLDTDYAPPPVGEAVDSRAEHLRMLLFEVGKEVLRLLPDNDGRELALDHLRDAYQASLLSCQGA